MCETSPRGSACWYRGPYALHAALREPYQGSSGILFKVYIWHCELIFIQFRRFRKTKSQKIASLAPLALRSLVFEPHLCWIQPVRLYAVAVYGFYGFTAQYKLYFIREEEREHPERGR